MKRRDWISGSLIAFAITSFVLYMCWLIDVINPESEKEYTIKYEIFWSKDFTEVKTAKNRKGYYVGSDRGTNFIKEGSITGNQVIKTSAPIRVISYTYVELKDSK